MCSGGSDIQSQPGNRAFWTKIEMLGGVFFMGLESLVEVHACLGIGAVSGLWRSVDVGVIRCGWCMCAFTVYVCLVLKSG